MKEINLSDSEFFRDTELKGLNSSETLLSDKEFYKCSFENCNMSKTTYDNCRFEDCEFNNCDLSLSKLKQCEFINVKFSNSKLLGINWTELRNLNNLEFHECKLNHSTFYGMDLHQVEIKECIVNEVDFTDAILQKANCSFSDFNGSKFSNTDLTNANFTSAKNYDINPNYNKIKKATFSIPEALTLLQAFDINLK